MITAITPLLTPAYSFIYGVGLISLFYTYTAVKLSPAASKVKFAFASRFRKWLRLDL